MTPESLEALDKYKRFRIANGEEITGESPLFRNVFSNNQASRTIKPLSKSSIDAILRRLAENIGIRTRGTSPYQRHEKRTEYGFRIRWNTIMKNHEPPLNNNSLCDINTIHSHFSETLTPGNHHRFITFFFSSFEFSKCFLTNRVEVFAVHVEIMP